VTKANKPTRSTVLDDSGRRKFLNTATFAGLAGMSLGIGGCKSDDKPGGATPATDADAAIDYSKYQVHPGQLDEYYAFSSGGHSGEVRVYALPSGRLLKRIPVFNVDCLVGWGITNESKQIMGTHADGTLKYWTGDTHHVHPSYTDGTYDGRYLFVNDKIHGRIARVRLDTMECDKITELPNVQGFHGIFPDKRDPLDSSTIAPRACSAAANFTFHSPTMAVTWTIRKAISAC
jgi:nitrous-oxide reductase